MSTTVEDLKAGLSALSQEFQSFRQDVEKRLDALSDKIPAVLAAKQTLDAAQGLADKAEAARACAAKAEAAATSAKVDAADAARLANKAAAVASSPEKSIEALWTAIRELRGEAGDAPLLISIQSRLAVVERAVLRLQKSGGGESWFTRLRRWLADWLRPKEQP